MDREPEPSERPLFQAAGGQQNGEGKGGRDVDVRVIAKLRQSYENQAGQDSSHGWVGKEGKVVNFCRLIRC